MGAMRQNSSQKQLELGAVHELSCPKQQLLGERAAQLVVGVAAVQAVALSAKVCCPSGQAVHWRSVVEVPAWDT